MKICVIGLGYVGLSYALMLATKHRVSAYDIDEKKVETIRKKKSPIGDSLMGDYLKHSSLTERVFTSYKDALYESELVIIATPTNYDSETHYFDTSSVETSIEKILKHTNDAIIVIKSTIPIGFVNSMRKRYRYKRIYFSPEFLREGKALYDSLHPSRIIVGDVNQDAEMILDLFQKHAIEKAVPTLLVHPEEAESIKLFANAYLAMRIGFFNELDSFCEKRKLSSREVIEGVCLDSRIGMHYNNPSFGYGGYCLPKDTKQLLANYYDTPNNIIQAIVDSNSTRKRFIVQRILRQKPKSVGIYRLIMKSDSDNFRQAAIIDILEGLRRENIPCYIYEPRLSDKEFNKASVIKDLKEFKEKSELIVANRLDPELNDVKKKVYTRDIFHRN